VEATLVQHISLIFFSYFTNIIHYINFSSTELSTKVYIRFHGFSLHRHIFGSGKSTGPLNSSRVFTSGNHCTPLNIQHKFETSTYKTALSINQSIRNF